MGRKSAADSIAATLGAREAKLEKWRKAREEREAARKASQKAARLAAKMTAKDKVFVERRTKLPPEWDAPFLLLLRRKRVTRTALSRYLESLMAAHAPIMVSTAMEELYRNMRFGDTESIRMTLESFQLLNSKGGPVVNINQRIGPEVPRSFEATILDAHAKRHQPVIEANGSHTPTAGDPS